MAFSIRGDDAKTILHDEDTSNGCVMWADRYTRMGDYGGWSELQLWETDEDTDDEYLVSVLNDELQWEDV